MSDIKRYYFDWAATAMPENLPPEEVPFANPSSKHSEGRAARAALEDARNRCATSLCVKSGQLYFTSGGTESDAIVLYSYYKRLSQGRGGIITSSTEHPAVLENCKTINALGADICIIDSEKNGHSVSVEALCRALQKQHDTGLVSLMHVNNETGAVSNIEELVAVTRENERASARRHIFFHSDMVQALGKIPIHLNAWDLDAASFAAHKLGGPRGIGLLYLKTPVDVLVTGGGHERGIRSGTENVAGAIALAHCIEKYANAQNLNAHYLAATQRMNYLINELTKFPRCKIVPARRGENDASYSPYIVQCSFDNIPGEVMQRSLDDMGFAVSTGSACKDVSKDRGNLNIIRISQGYSTTKDDINALLDAIKNILHRM